MNPQRLDIALVERNLAPSRTAAQALIERGSVLVNGAPARKASSTVSPADEISVTAPLAYVSRGGEKLAGALDAFSISPAGKIALDIGSSTGGFTDCLLQRGAAKVFSVDVGTGQLHPSLRARPEVVSIEQTDIRDVASLPEPIDIAVIDASFISLEHVFPALRRIIDAQQATFPDHSASIDAIALVKPQFETPPEAKNRAGVVTDERLRAQALERAEAAARANGFEVMRVITSPITGGEGNVEYLMHARS